MKRQIAGIALALSASFVAWGSAAETAQEPRFARAISCQPGWVSLELTPDVLDVAQADLGDLRVTGPAGDVPYALEEQLNALPEALAFFDVESTPGRETVAVIDRGEQPALLSCVSINAAGEDAFLKPVVIEASADRAQFRRLAAASVFRVAGRAQTSVCFPQSDQRYLRFRFDDRNSAPIQPLTLATPLDAVALAEHVLPVTIEPPNAADADPYSYLLKLPSHRLPARSLSLTISDPAFSRVVNVAERVLFRDEMSLRLVGSARVERTPSGEAELSVPLGQLSSSTLVLELEKAGPPLHVEHAELTVAPRSLVFLAPAGALSLRYGGEHLHPPPSDVREVLRRSRPAHFASATLGAQSEEPAKLTPAPVRGPPVDAKTFASVHDLTLPSAGHTAFVDVDGELASALASLRIVDAASQQVPYVVERREHTRKLPLGLKVTQSGAKTVATLSGLDPKQHVHALELAGNGPEFYTRPVQLFETVRDKRGVVERRVVGEGSWLRQPGDPEQPLELAVASDARELELEIDNGDNPPLVPSSAQAFVESTRLDFSFVPGDKFTLLAKKPSLSAPRYDLELIAATLIDSPGAAATLGPERASSAPASPATPAWFWPAAAGALALVVIVLLRSMLAKSEPQR